MRFGEMKSVTGPPCLYHQCDRGAAVILVKGMGLSSVAQVAKRLPPWFAVSLTVLSAVFAWWFVGNQDFRGEPPEYLSYIYGPYDIPVTILWVVGAVAGLGVLSGLAWELVRFASKRTHQGASPLTLPVVGILMYAAAVVSLSWRVITAGTDGANIGGGLFLMESPWYIGGLMITAFVLERKMRKGRMSSRKAALWTLASALILVPITVFLTFTAGPLLLALLS